MKFNLLGEFSGLHYALKIGLENYGHQVFLLSDGDRIKNIPNTININNIKFSHIPNGQLNALLTSLLKVKFPKADCTSLISPLIFGGSRFLRELISLILIFKAQKRSKVLSLCAAGSDSFWLKFVEKNLEYYPFDSNDDPKPAFRTFPTPLLNNYVANKVDKIIGFSPDYYYSYASIKAFSSKTSLLPMIGCRLIKSSLQFNNCSNKPIKVLFGSNKKSFKGAKFILPALKKFANNFSDVEILNPKMCSINEWENYVRNCDILVDQCRTYSYGINALYGFAYGKCVLSGWRWPSNVNKSYLFDDPPIINICPSIDSVYDGLVLGYKKIKYGNHDYKKVCNFYDKNHSPIVLARKFLSIIN